MKTYTILSARTAAALYEGAFESFVHCLEQAVREGIDLSHADLRNRNLANACLDDGLLEGADFSNSNLTGANLSEANLRGASFYGTDLYNACMACADLSHCNFEDASFGATDISGSDISFSRFSTLSCFTLDFNAAQRLEKCSFTDEGQTLLSWSAPPVVVRGLGRKILVFAEQRWMHGHNALPYPVQTPRAVSF